MKWLLVILVAWLSYMAVGPVFWSGHSLERAEQVRAMSYSKNAWNVCVNYALDHENEFPEAYDHAFIDLCIREGYIEKDKREDYSLPTAKPGTTGFTLLPGRKLRDKGSELLLVTTEPVNQDIYVAISTYGKTEALPAAKLLTRLLTTLNNTSPSEPKDL